MSPIVVPPGTGVEGLVLDGLNLAQGANGSIQLEAFTPPLFKKRHEWVEAADSDGGRLARDPLVSVGQAVARLAIAGANRDDANAIIWSIVHKLEEADRNPGGIPLVWTPAGSSTYGTCYVLTGEVTEFPVDWQSGYMVAQPSITFALDCAPGWYGTPVVYGPVTAAGPLVSLTLADVLGDVPADGTLTITNDEAEPIRHLEWGAEHRHYNPAAPWSLVLDSDSLVTSGFAGTQTALAGSYDPNATGNSAIQSTVAATPQAICGTGAQPHIGTFRVKARVNSGPSGCDAYFRFAWRVGDGQYTTNDPVRLTKPTQAFYAVDLGLIKIPETPQGTQAWDGRVEAWSTTADTLYVDLLMLIPVEAGYGKSTATFAYSPGVISARDSFAGLGSGSALNGRTPDAGAAWVTSGVATDFVGDTTASGPTTQPRVTRTTAVVEAEARAGVLGSAMTDQQVQATVFVNSAGYSAGVVARYVDDDNYLWLRVRRDGSDRFLELVKKISGTATVIASSALTGGGISPSAPGYFDLIVFASGRAIGSVSGGNIATVDTTDTVLATAGTLASGKGGIADQSLTVGANYRKYDDVVISTPSTEPVVAYASRSFEITSSATERESSAGGTWGRPPSYRGSRFRVGPAGDRDRTTRVVVFAHRNDLDSQPWEPMDHSITLEAEVTPRYGVIPGA